MARNEIGRNDICPCGSGRKYKNCCYEKKEISNHSISKVTEETLLLPIRDQIDYGKPLINEDFYRKNNCHEISAPRLIYSVLLSPEVERMAEKISKQYVNRGRDEAMLINNTKSAQQLIDIMKNVPDSLNRVLLQEKLLYYKQATVPLIIEELRKTQHHAFFEIAVRVLHTSGNDYSDEIISIIRHHQRNAYAVSLLCMLLGFYDNMESEKLLWDYFHYFKERWPHDTLSDGPLLGLEEMRARRAEDSVNRTIH